LSLATHPAKSMDETQSVNQPKDHPLPSAST
jgi:hypothetical protein